ncbi:MAG: CRISPR-associated endonuclease Cas3'', partial [Thermoplasmata archaeon]
MNISNFRDLTNQLKEEYIHKLNLIPEKKFYSAHVREVMERSDNNSPVSTNEIKRGKVEQEYLEKHLDLSLEYFLHLIEKRNLEKIINKMINDIFVDYNEGKEDSQLIMHDFLKKMILTGIYYHDIGKVNPAFQNKKCLKKKDKEDSSHSLYSAMIVEKLLIDYVNYFIYQVKMDKEKEEYFIKISSAIIFIIRQSIKWHHTHLQDFNIRRFVEDGFEDEKGKTEKIKDKILYEILKYDQKKEVFKVENTSV